MMTLTTLRKIFTIFSFAFIFSTVSIAEAAPLVRGIEVTGQRRVDAATIKLQVKSAIGEQLNSSQVSNDIKNIYRTGFFETVSAETTPADGGVVLVFTVKEFPAIRKLSFSGNEEVSDSSLKEQLNIGAKRFLDRRKIRDAIKQTETFYREKGFYGTKIEYRVDVIDSQLVDLHFSIVEGKEKVVREIIFEGNEFFDDDDLEDVISLSTYSWYASWLTGSGTVKEGQLDEDKRLISQEYLRSGFVDVRIGDPIIEEKEDKLAVRYRIEEGSRYRVDKLSANGDMFEDDLDKTLDGVESKEGEFFNAEQIQKDSLTIADKFTDIGYAFANVEPQTAVDRNAKTVDVTFQISKGGIVNIDRINITGNQKTGDNVIRRSLVIQEQELYSSSKIRRSQELVERLGYFEEVSVTSSPAAKPDYLDLAVAVREGSTGSFSAGAGVSSDDGFIVSFRLAETNLFGSGNNANLSINTGSRRENYVASFENPRVRDTQWSFGANAVSVERDFDDFDRSQAGGSLSVGYPLWFLGQEAFEDVRFSLTYELLQIEIDNLGEEASQLIRDEAEKGKTIGSSVSPRIIRNTINNPLDPTKGSRQVFDIELAGLGGDEKFWLLNLSNSWYYPVIDLSFGPIVFSQRTSFGYGETFGSDTFPLYRRFFPGGINSVRGYDDRELGPKDDEGSEFGGNKEVVANFEFILPLVPSAGLKTVFFYDMGQAFDDEENIALADLRHAVGWGIRWRSPIAPIRIELGYPLDKEEGDDSMVVNFSFGAPL